MSHNDNDIDKAYVSPFDKLLYGFDATHPLSLSQQEEIDKHQKIATLRDNASSDPSNQTLWTEF